MDNIIKNKRGLKLVISHFSGYETNLEKILYLLYAIWSSLMMQCKALFELFQKSHLKIYESKFMTS